ncbi:MAG TPA: hypothetical protein VMG30_16845 [Acidobacteriota bacterium]|nr:hypothetical protein [Acidobacteriota bacterium]
MQSIGRDVRRCLHIMLLVGCAECCLSLAKDDKMTPEALIAQHLKSIGSPDQLAKIQSRIFTGATTVRFVQGATGEYDGQCQFASDGRKMGIILRYRAQDYRSEHIAFDGKDVTIKRFTAGGMSPLADFINSYDGILKEGLLGGVLCVAWPLKNIQESQPRLKYDKAKLKGRPMHSLEYRPRKGLGDFKIVLFFEPETFRHVRTEYRLQISATSGSGPATNIGIEKPDSYYILSEEFSDFKEVDGMTLPHRYTLGVSKEGQVGTFLGYWTLVAEQWIHNGDINPNIFKTRE